MSNVSTGSGNARAGQSAQNAVSQNKDVKKQGGAKGGKGAGGERELSFEQLLGASETTATPAKALSGGQVLEGVLAKQLRDIEKSSSKGDYSKDANAALAKLNKQAGAEGGGTKQNSDSKGAAGDAAGKADAGQVSRPGSISAEHYLDMVRKSQEESHNKNVEYLMLQKRIGDETSQQTTLSNLMKVRNDAVKATIDGSGQ